MGRFVVGDIVVVSFPFSDLSGQKLRPALVLAHGEFDNLILCQITSRPYTSKRAIKLVRACFADGGLPVTSYVRIDKLFTAEPALIERLAATLRPQTREKILKKVRAL